MEKLIKNYLKAIFSPTMPDNSLNLIGKKCMPIIFFVIRMPFQPFCGLAELVFNPWLKVPIFIFTCNFHAECIVAIFSYNFSQTLTMSKAKIPWINVIRRCSKPNFGRVSVFVSDLDTLYDCITHVASFAYMFV